ncbi:MAG: selenocysteine-specific translation elongation factor [Proteobacteria bacterium]|nr:selenocysteine-specific translation elongation factor [Pseudomonadota bacterium]MBU4470858.1 selenocysteine-specific translation elongation factor [Pseudomonadota bacterium]MCG2753778.1 selenocysteine-specific translation elongation factor [Desulfobacteraceae bacterium]
MKQIILGTAGHIDHGKTSLVKALTGTDTDRLKEEKERGITIELGFASLDLPGGRHLSIVDVPGHEKFVKNMVAGASGIDMVAMIIAADEGVMPQTREHLEICALLGIRYGLVVLTKADMVDEEWLELAKEDVMDFVQGTFLEDRPMISVSSTTGAGIPELLKALDDLTNEVPERSATALFRLPVDRVFTMKGFGTVITGSLISGKIRVGETIMVYPSGVTSKVRGIQAHNDSVEEAHAGMRTAINFQGLEKASVNRGDILARPGTLKPNFMADLDFKYLKSNVKPLKNRTRVRFHTGTSEIPGNLILLDREDIKPGESAVVQIRLDEPVNIVKDDRFVVRSYSPVRTIGGGNILNPIPEKHKRFSPEINEGLETLIQGSPEDLIAFHVKTSGVSGLSFSDLILMTNLPEKALSQAVQSLLSDKTLILTDKENQVYIHRDTSLAIQEQVRRYLTDFHEIQPLKPGMSKEELKSKFPLIPNAKLFNQTLDRMVKDNHIVIAEDVVRLANHKISLGVDQTKVRDTILKTYRDSGLAPPYFRDVAKEMDMDPQSVKDVLMHLVEEGVIIKTKDDLYFYRSAMEDLKQRIIDFLENHGEITIPQFKELTGASRKYLIPLIEYFDAEKLTIRVGDIRKLRKA